MSKELYNIKFQTCNICNAMLRNINDNFISVSFDIINNEILVKIILEFRSEVEDNYIDEMITEFTALQMSDCVRKPLIEMGKNQLSLKYLVYQKKI